jgi:hypothetical protein
VDTDVEVAEVEVDDAVVVAVVVEVNDVGVVGKGENVCGGVSSIFDTLNLLTSLFPLTILPGEAGVTINGEGGFDECPFIINPFVCVGGGGVF